MKFSKLIPFVIIFISTTSLNYSQELSDSTKYLGQSCPGLIPEIFAPGIVSLEDRLEFNTTFSPDGKEFYFTIGSPNWNHYRIMYTKLENNRWTTPDTAEFCSRQYDDLEPSFTPDGQYLYFTSGRPPSKIWDMWRIKRTENVWGEPEHLSEPVNTIGYENYPFITQTGTMYFVSSRPGTEYKMDIYRSEPADGKYLTVENLGDSVNSDYNEFDPYVAPDESYILFSSNRPGGYGKTDLYISYRKGDHTWTKPRNMGVSLNTHMGEGAGPKISSDGKYFFFSRYGDNTSDIYWVDAKALDNYLPTGINHRSNNKIVPQNFCLNQNYPNPFNASTIITFELLKASEVELYILDGLGKQVRSLGKKFHPGGTCEVLWEGNNDAGNPLCSGVYFIQMATDRQIVTRKALLLK
jgi:Tol biopolymer transport system component